MAGYHQTAALVRGAVQIDARGTLDDSPLSVRWDSSSTCQPLLLHNAIVLLPFSRPYETRHAAN